MPWGIVSLRGLAASGHQAMVIFDMGGVITDSEPSHD